MATTTGIQVSFPKELAFALKLGDQELAREVLRLTLVKLYELGKISSGMAAKLLGVGRLEFLEIAGAYRVSLLGEPTAEEIQEDFSHA